MEKHLNRVWSASAALEMLQFQTDQAHESLVQALCEAMAVGIAPADVAAAANMSVRELFNTLRRPRTAPPATDSDTAHNS
ncbi:hypothetical protein [Arthrobacter sp. OAP107]|uniref:hypothetical protein n=1 Tax=Arthrobacter sp. OAP107 TaxID=3156445 RepID=UPI003393CFE1